MSQDKKRGGSTPEALTKEEFERRFSALFNRAEIERAAQVLRRARRDHPDWSKPYLHLANISLDNDDIKTAKRYLNQAEKLASIGHEDALWAAKLFSALHLYKQAGEMYEKAALGSKAVEGLMRASASSRDELAEDSSAEKITQAGGICSKADYEKRITNAIKTGDTERAKRLSMKARREHKAWADPSIYLASLSIEANEKEEAMKFLRQAEKRPEVSRKQSLVAARSLKQLGRHKIACRYFQKIFS